MESSGNEEVDTLLFFRCLYVSFGGNVFAYLSSGSYVDVFSVSFKYEVFPKQTSILQTPILFLFPPFSAEGFPIFIHPQAKGLTTINSFSCPGSHHIPSVLPEVSLWSHPPAARAAGNAHVLLSVIENNFSGGKFGNICQ